MSERWTDVAHGAKHTPQAHHMSPPAHPPATARDPPPLPGAPFAPAKFYSPAAAPHLLTPLAQMGTQLALLKTSSSGSWSRFDLTHLWCVVANERHSPTPQKSSVVGWSQDLLPPSPHLQTQRHVLGSSNWFPRCHYSC